MIKQIPESILFFVYGTLLKGEGNHRCLEGENVEYCGKFETEPKYTMSNLGGFPAVHIGGDTSIKGELYKTTNPDVIRRVFRLEGFNGVKGDSENHFYDVTTFTTPKGEATMFIFKDRSPRNIIKSGNWLNR